MSGISGGQPPADRISTKALSGSDLSLERPHRSLRGASADNFRNKIFDEAEPMPTAGHPIRQVRCPFVKKESSQRVADFQNRVEGHSYAEVDNRLGISERMVAKELVRAMTHRRERLKHF